MTPAYEFKTWHRLAYFLARITLGVVLFAFGATKIFHQGVGAFADGMVAGFEGLLPDLLLIPYVWTLPFAELLIGLLLIAGLWSMWTLTATGLLLVTLTFGAVIGADPATTANNLIYVIITFFLLWNLQANRYSLDYKLGLRYDTDPAAP